MRDDVERVADVALVEQPRSAGQVHRLHDGGDFQQCACIELLQNPDSIERQTGSVNLPGALVDDFAFTL